MSMMDGMGLLGTAQPKTEADNEDSVNARMPVPGTAPAVRNRQENVPAAIRGEDLMERVFNISNELYFKMRDPSTGVEEDHRTIIQLLTDLGRQLVNAERASFWRLDHEEKAIWTIPENGSGRIEIPIGTGIVGKALAEGRTLVSNDPHQDPFFSPEVDRQTGYVTRSVMVMPISNSRGEYIGAYQVINKLDGDGKFDMMQDSRRLSLAAFICSITLESELFLADAEMDRLTKVRNRLGFYHDFSMRYGDGIERRHDTSGAMIMGDIDYFKSINDTYGHNAGDAMLRHVANVLKETIRKDDVVYRWGGEEFIVLLSDTDTEGAAIVAEKVRAAIEASECVYDGTSIAATMSFGCGSVNAEMTAEENIAVCDKRLYTAKESGRNRVVKV